jgi:hypothetical protein
MLRKNQPALQVFKDGTWKYVFCRNQDSNEVITTDARRKAQGGHSLQYFQERKANDTFRIEERAEH